MNDERIELLTQFHVGIPRAKVVQKLWDLRKEIQGAGALDLATILLLSDVCNALSLDDAETSAVLGIEGEKLIQDWKDEAIAPVEVTIASP